MKQLLQRDDNYGWKLDGIEFAIQERVGDPHDFIGRVEELEYLYRWANWTLRGVARGVAFLGRRKVGKSLILERLYNILYSEQKGLIPFYYEFTEGERSGKDFYRDFVTRFYMQVIGYYTRDILWNRGAVDNENKVQIEQLQQAIEPLSFPNKRWVEARLQNSYRILQTDRAPYEYVLAAVAAPAGFANMPAITDRMVQMIDEFQYLNMYIDAGVVDKPCMAYMSTAEQRTAPLIITGSWMGVVAEELIRWLPHRFAPMTVPKMNPAEAQAMTMRYGEIYGHDLTPAIAEYIVYTTNGIPGRIIELLTPRLGKPMIATLNDVDQALEFEVSPQGVIKGDWDEYLDMAMEKVNDVNLRRMTYFLCKKEGTWYYPRDLKQAMGLEIEERKLRQELELLYKYDIIDIDSGRYGGIFDRTLKKVLMKNYGDLFDLPLDEFNAYFKNDNMLDYLGERAKKLEMSLAEARTLRGKLGRLRGQHNNLKGHYYEREVMLRLIKAIIDDDGGLVAGIGVTEFSDKLNYHPASGGEFDIVLAGETAVVMAECKNYAPDHTDKITTTMIDDFITKATRLHAIEFPDHDLRLAFFSKHGFETPVLDHLQTQNVSYSI